MANNMDKNSKKEGKNMKNPIAYFKHLWKDPINTMEEAKTRTNEIFPWFLGSLVLAVAGGLLSELLGIDFLMIFGIIGAIGVIAFGLPLFVIKKAKEKFRALTCNKCNTMAEIKTPEDFEKYIYYTIGKNEAEFKGFDNIQSKDGVVPKIRATGKASAVVTIDLKCPHCGSVKRLEYRIAPFKCSIEQKNVRVRDVKDVKEDIEIAIRGLVSQYNDPERRQDIPYTIHSVKHPDYANRSKPVVGKGGTAYPKYNGVIIDYHKDVEEMVEQYFLINQVDGKMIDLSVEKK